MIKLAITTALVFSALPAFAGPGACVQTLIAIQQSAHGGWLKGVAPSLVRGVKGHNDVVLLQRKDGSYVVNEGAKFYSLPIQRPLPGKSGLLTSKSNEKSQRSHSLLPTEAARLITPQGNEVDLHFFGTAESQVAILRARGNDQAGLESILDSVKRGDVASDVITEKTAKELEMCDNEKSGSVGSLTTAVADIVRGPGELTAAENESSKKRMLRANLEDLKEQKKGRQAEMAELESLRKKMAANDSSLGATKLTLHDLPSADVEKVLSEVSTTFSEKMAESEISDTDRAEIKKECGDEIKLPERKPTASEKLKAAACDSMSSPQKEICELVFK